MKSKKAIANVTAYGVSNLLKTDREFSVNIEDGYAAVSLEVDAQSIGCILVSHKKD